MRASCLQHHSQVSEAMPEALHWGLADGVSKAAMFGPLQEGKEEDRGDREEVGWKRLMSGCGPGFQLWELPPASVALADCAGAASCLAGASTAVPPLPQGSFLLYPVSLCLAVLALKWQIVLKPGSLGPAGRLGLSHKG